MNFNRIEEIARALYDPDEHPLRTFHATFILQKRKLLSIGINSPKTDPTNLFNPKVGREGELIHDKGTCSELAALKKLISKSQIRTEKCWLVNIRINRNGELDWSPPCSSCQSLLKRYSFDKVFYSGNMGEFKRYS